MSGPTPVTATNDQGPRDSDPIVLKARSLSTFAAIWVDEFRHEIHIAVTDDADGVALELQPLVPKHETLMVHLFPRSMAELKSIVDRLMADHEDLAAAGIYLSSWGLDEKGNCVEVDIDPLTSAVADEFTTRYGSPLRFQFSARPLPTPSAWPTEPEVVEAGEVAATGDRLVTCGGAPFPASVLDQSYAGEVPPDIVDPLAAAVTFWQPEFGGLTGLDWRLAQRDEVSAEFVAARGQSWVDLELSKDAQGWRPGNVGECLPYTNSGIEGTGPAGWVFDSAYDPPTRDSTELHLLITEFACSGGIPAFGRISPPEIAYATDSLTLTVGVRPVPGPAACPGNPSTPVTVKLPRPLGDRAVLDGSKYPPSAPRSSEP